MKTGWTILCPKCGTLIDDFTLSDEWFCDCGESGIFEPDDDEEPTDAN